MRYAATCVPSWVLPWLRRPVPPRYWRKVVAAVQGIVLTVAASGLLPDALARSLLAGRAGCCSCESFGRRRLVAVAAPSDRVPAAQAAP